MGMGDCEAEECEDRHDGDAGCGLPKRVINEANIQVDASTCVAVGDFNGDGSPDIVAANVGNSSVSVLLGTGAGSFQAQATSDVLGAPFGVAVGDYNGDCHLDIVTTNQNSNTVSVLLGDGDGSFKAQATFNVESGPFGVAVGDFNRVWRRSSRYRRRE